MLFTRRHVLLQDIIDADNSKLTQRVYNVTAMSFTPAEVAASIARVIPGFTCDYKPDFRQVRTALDII